MSMIEVVYWTMWAFMLGLFIVLYLRVDWHDWGAVGMTGVTLGLLILLSTTIYRYYGGRFFVLESGVLWKVLVLGFGPVAIAGYVAGMIRDPIPLPQIARRLLALAVVIIAALLIIDVFVRGT